MTSTLDTALELHRHGYSTVPVTTDGTKRPKGPWKHLQTARATEQEIREWFTTGNAGLGVITGKVSGNLEMLEIEGRAAHQITHLQDLAKATGLGPLWEKITTGWFELSPSGGYHWFYRLDHPTPGNTKIAQASNHETIAETRGEGGFVVIAPSNGTVHPTGKPWARLQGGPTTTPTITRSERETLHALFAATLDQRQNTPEPVQDTLLDQALRNRPTSPDNDGIKPGDDYEAKTTWAQILEPHGWTKVSNDGQTTYWKRPGKTDPGFSATTGHAADRDRLYVFSTSTEFQAEHPYTKFGAYALLTHAGDHSAAAKALRAAGHGTEPTRSVTKLPAPPTPATTAGNLALATVHQIKPDADTPTIATTDDGNAIALIDTYGDQLRYNPDRGRWLHWDGTRWHWQANDGGEARELGKRIARNLPEHDDWKAHKKRSLSAKGITDMLIQARTDTRITVGIDDLDAQPWELNTPGGIVNLRTGQLEPADPTKLHTKITSCTPDPEAAANLWHNFLDTTFNGQTELIQYMQRLSGYSLVGEVRDHILPFVYGSGGNGKSVFLDTMIATLGEYATSSPNGFLMASHYPAHTTEIARLKGARFVVCNEVNESDRFDEAKVKSLTGGDTLTARFMRKDDFTFTPTHHLWLAGNFQPSVESGGDSFWRRLRLIPFTHTVPKQDQIEGLKETLAAQHGPAVLAWAIQGAADYAAHGLQEPDTVTVATTDYAASTDTVGRFIDEECTITPNYYPGLPATAMTAVRAAYERWCSDNGETPLSPRSLTTQLNRHGVATGAKVPKGPKGTRLYGGISIRSNQPEADLFDGDRGGY
ncbi:MAG: bifunctional DNA primase/polymerase [Renibacterium sp.]|nr:bifunctional DNA primase/polymerase [Renibacterium sp.]